MKVISEIREADDEHARQVDIADYLPPRGGYRCIACGALHDPNAAPNHCGRDGCGGRRFVEIAKVPGQVKHTGV